MRPILKKNTGKLHNVRCVDCINYDETRQVGYTCLILGMSKNPTRWELCIYFIHKTQTVLGSKGVP